MSHRRKLSPTSASGPSSGAEQGSGVIGATNRIRHGDVLAVFTLIVLTLIPYAQSAWFDFINFDDPSYVSDNELVSRGLTWTSVRDATFRFHASNWHPLVWISYMAEVEAFGMSPGVMHITNVALHILNSTLVFSWLRVSRQDSFRSFCAALLFAIHPAHVESVAWITERKDVLSTLFLLLSLVAYTKYASLGSMRWYLVSLANFVLGLSAKAMLVTMPLLLVLIDFWPLGRFRFDRSILTGPLISRLIREKIPYIVLSAVLCIVTIAAQKTGGAVSDLAALSLTDRVCNAAVAYVRYCWTSVWPFQLSAFYPLPPNGWEPGVVVLSVMLLVIATLYCIKRREDHPVLLVGWLWFLFTLLPVIGLMQVGIQSMADRYLYIPMIGLTLMLLWSVPDRWLTLSPAQAVIAVGITVVLTVRCFDQVSIWKNSISLFERSLQVVPEHNIVAFQNLLVAYNHARRYEDALRISQAGTREYSNDSFLWLNMGNALRGLERGEEALECYRKAVHLEPESSESLNNLGLMLCRSDDPVWITEGMQFIRRAIKADPQNAHAHNSLGNALVKMGQLDAAAEHYRLAIRLGDLEGAKRNLQFVEEELLKLRK